MRMWYDVAGQITQVGLTAPRGKGSIAMQRGRALASIGVLLLATCVSASRSLAPLGTFMSADGMHIALLLETGARTDCVCRASPPCLGNASIRPTRMVVFDARPHVDSGQSEHE